MISLLPGITIFTPTYNRSSTLNRLYKSIKEQINESNYEYVEWLIVDDGSSDDSKIVIDNMISENIVNIRYIYKSNGGKHTALNTGIKNSSKQYFLCVDSDDFLAETAIDVILNTIKEYSPDGIIAYKSNFANSELIGDIFPDNVTYSTLFDLINKYHCSGDRTLIYKTDILNKIEIPEPDGVKFFPETYLYDKFDEKHKCLLLRDGLCVCEYLPGGYSDSFRLLMINNCISMKWFYAERIDMNCDFSLRYKFIYRYIGYTLLSKFKGFKYKGKYKILFPLAFLPGVAMFILYRFSYLNSKRGK